MSLWEALLLGLIQGLTEFLPVSSSGHIELGKAILGVEIKEDLLFTVLLHLATALSTLVVFRSQISALFLDLLKPKRSEKKTYISYLIISMVPVGVVGLLFENQIETFFNGNILLVGCMLIVTSGLLWFASRAEVRTGDLGYGKVLIIGLAQAVAILPGISRSGATISTGLLLGIRRETVAQFSFLMVLAPILGASLLKVKDYLGAETADSQLPWVSIAVGFIAAFISGYLACKWMITLVQKGKLGYFALYCLLAGAVAVLSAIL